MPPLGSERAAGGIGARDQVERILQSPGFARNERLSRFLRMVIERHLEGRDDELKESLIAIEVFGRPADYDPKRDPVVRAEASRLRARLAEYYQNEGKHDPLVIEIPKGGYTPRFRQVSAPDSVVSPVIPEAAKPQRTRRALTIGLVTASVLFAASTAWWWFGRKNAPIPIAVLPLENLSHDPANDYFADGLTDELIRNLAMIEGLSPRSRTSSFAFKNKPRDVREIGKQLGAEYIVEGSVLRAGQQLRINAQLIRTRDDFAVWSGKYDQEVTDVFAIQDEIARSIVNTLRVKLGRGRRRYETNTAAYDLYLRARSLNNSGTEGTIESIPLFEQAIARDAAFAPAYGGLAAAYGYESGFFEADRDDLAKMRTAAERAVALDPLLPEAYDGLGAAYARDGQWKKSETSFRRAIELDPSSSSAHSDFAMFLLLPLGRIEEAVQQMRIAEKSDPLSPLVQSRFAHALLSAGHDNEAAPHCERAADRLECLGRVRICQGRFDEAIQLLSSVKNPRYLGHALGRAGRRAEAEQLIATSAQHPFQQALIFAGLGDKDRTFEALDRMAVQGPVRIGRTLTYPEFSLIRGDPRVKALRQKVGLPQETQQR